MSIYQGFLVLGISASPNSQMKYENPTLETNVLFNPELYKVNSLHP